MPGYKNMRELLREEFRQSREEGKDGATLDALYKEHEENPGTEEQQAALHEKLLALPISPDFPFDEPGGLEEIRARRHGGSRSWKLDLSDDELFDKLYGAWLGRCAGCALGKPAEAFFPTHNGMLSWQRQKRYLTAVSPDEWPLRDYFPKHSPAESETGQVGCPLSTRDEISHMETDDDIRYTVLGQCILRDFGREFTPAHVGMTWFDKLPYRHTFTAETQAYRNMVLRYKLRGVPKGEAGWEKNKQFDWHWVSHHLNPYREWIGAQIRVDSYGYAAPGRPELAAELAWRDATISHAKNGIYGAMFCAAMISSAFVTEDPMEIIEAGLAEIPQTSRLYAEMRQVIELCARHGNDMASFEAVIEGIHELLGHYDPIHTNNNAGVCVAALLLSRCDFSRGITFAVMAGLDTDCNGATVGSIVGAIAGAKSAPEHWVGRLNDTLKSLIIDYHPIAISECARRSVRIVREVLA